MLCRNCKCSSTKKVLYLSIFVSSSLKTGYVALPCGVVVPMTFSSLEMPQMGEDGTPRRQYSFIFKAG